MELAVTMVLVAAMLTAAGYAQFRIPRHTAGAGRVALARGVLVVTGIALGYVAARHYAGPFGVPQGVAFLLGFGVVHVPAAVLLWLKQRRGAGKS